MIFRNVVWVVLLWWGAAGLAHADELRVRYEIDQRVSQMFNDRDYAALEQMAATFRDGNETSPSGLQKLTLFYSGVSKKMERSLRLGLTEPGLMQRIDDWQTAYPNSPTSAIVRAIALRNVAWHIRGGGYAASVDADAWAPFYAKLQEAEAVLVDAKDYAAIDAHWYIERAYVLTHQGAAPDAFADHMEEALESHPGYYQLYFAAIEYLAPKWHGNALMIEDFAQEMTARTRDVEGESLYARIYWYVAQTQYDDRLFQSSYVEWDQMRTGMMDVLARYPDQWNIQNFAYFACLAEDRDMLGRLLSRMDDQPIMRVWRRPELLAYCRDMAAPL